MPETEYNFNPFTGKLDEITIVPEEILVHQSFQASSALRSFIFYADIIGTPPTGTVFDIDPDNQSFTVMLPIPYSYTSGLQNLKFWNNDIELPITEGIRTYVTGRNQDPLSLDWVFAFRCDTDYDSMADSNGLYKITFDEKVIPIAPEGIPFSGKADKPFFNSVRADNIMFPKLLSPYVYEVWRWIRNDTAVDGLSKKKQSELGVMKIFKEGNSRYRLACRGDKEEYTLQEFAQRLDFGYLFFQPSWNTVHPRTVPFQFCIYNTVTGARSLMSHTYGYVQTGIGIETMGFRRILDK